VAILTSILNTLIVLLSLFLICLILIQRGKGGGLAGAFGGVGGSSAFGTKAGDIFTRVTMYVAIAWIVLGMILVVLYNRPGPSAFDDGSTAASSKEVAPKSSKEKGKGPAKSAAPASTPAAPASGPSPVSAPAIPAPATPK
jgi:preprotein translocase subunit SecG